MSASQKQRFDVVIVGGGPAGLTAAIAAAEKGCRSIALIERKRRWGWPIQCAELVPKLITQIVPLQRDAIVQPVTGLRLHLDGDPIGFLRAPGYVLDRARFEAALADRAARLGVSLWPAAGVRSVTNDTAVFVRNGKEHTFETRILIGADGPRSVVRRTLFRENLETAFGIQNVVPLARKSDEAEIFLSQAYGAGYGWCFPRGDEANVGVALDLDRRGEAAAALNDLQRRLIRAGKTVDTKAIRRTGGMIPVGGPLERTSLGSVLLVGDAAGHVHPLTGAGIFTACACGRLAGQAAAKTIRSEGFDHLADYNRRWRDLYDDSFARGRESRRRILNAEPETYARALFDAWRLDTGREAER